MQIRFSIGFIGILGAALSGMAQTGTPGQDLEQQLHSLYPAVQLNSNKTQVLQPGTILTVQKPGLMASAPQFIAFVNNVKEGRLKHAFASDLLSSTDPPPAALQVGERLYLLKLDVKDSSIAFHLQVCGDCNPASVPDKDAWRTTVVFQFQKGYLRSTDLQRVQQAISEVLAAEVPSAQANIASAPGPEQVAQQPAAQVHIEGGQTIDQVLAAMGQPDKIVNLGARQIFIYKDLKITFQNGRVSDVE